MMNEAEKAQHKKILGYWRAFESFEMPEVEHEHIRQGYVGKPFSLDTAKQLPWPMAQKEVNTQKETTSYQFHIFIGVLLKSVITNNIKKIINASAEDYGIQQQNAFTCLGAIVLNEEGRVISDYGLPDYVASLLALKKCSLEDKHWDINFKEAKKELEACGLKFITNNIEIDNEAIEKHLKELIGILNVVSEDDITTKAVIRIKQLRGAQTQENIPYYQLTHNQLKRPIDIGKENDDEENDEDQDNNKNDSEKPSAIFPSFFLGDLNKVLNAVDSNNFGSALRTYLHGKPSSNRKDIISNRQTMRELVSPAKLTASRWPIKNKFPLSLTQQLAVNQATEKQDDIFSINGPPGTGKTTWLSAFLRGFQLQKI